MARSSVSDNWLIQRVSEGDTEAAYALLVRHTGIVGWAIRDRNINAASGQNLPGEDAEQEGLYALWRAINSYDPSRGDDDGVHAQFTTYAKRVVSNAIEDAWRSANTQRQSALNASISLDSLGPSRDEAFSIGSGEDVAASALNDLEFRADLGALKSALTDQEYHVLRGHLAGLTYAEIAEVTALSYKAVDGAMQRIRRKARALGSA